MILNACHVEDDQARMKILSMISPEEKLKRLAVVEGLKFPSRW